VPDTFIKIASVTVGSGGASSIDFTSIPSTYTDLLVKVSGRKTSTGGSNLQMQFNGSTSGYSQRVLLGNGSTAASYSDTSEIGFMYVTTSSDTSNTFSSTDIYIPNYAGSNNKSVSIDNVQENNGTTANAALTAALWSNSAAINRVYLQIANGAGTFAQYSTATLYGIKNS
jgi:hypothetical protein